MSELINIEVIEPTPVPIIEIHVDINAAQSAIDAAAQAQLILDQISELIGNSALNGITTLGTIAIDADQVTFSGFAWKIAGTDYAQVAPITRTLPFASEGMYRTHTAYFTTTNDIDIAVGPEDDEVTTEPNIPEGTLRMRAFNVFGEVITAGPGEALPYDINLLDLLLQNPQPGDFLLINVSGIDFRVDFQRFIDVLGGGSQNLLDVLTIGNPLTFANQNDRPSTEILFNEADEYPLNNGTEVSLGYLLTCGIIDDDGTILVYPEAVETHESFDVSAEYKILNNSEFNVLIAPATVGVDTPVTLIGGNVFIPQNSIAIIKFLSETGGYTASITFQPYEMSGVEWVVVSSNKTAVNNEQYSNTNNATYTDPTGVEGKGYVVKVSQGVATIGGENYSAGYLVYRTYRGSEWFTQAYVDAYTIGETIAALASAVNGKAPKAEHSNVASTTITGTTTETVAFQRYFDPAEIPSGKSLYSIFTFLKTGTLGIATYRIRIGATGTTADQRMATFAPSSSTLYAPLDRIIEFLSGNEIMSFPDGNSVPSGFTGSAFAATFQSYDYTTNGFYLSVTVQLVNSADSVILRSHSNQIR